MIQITKAREQDLPEILSVQKRAFTVQARIYHDDNLPPLLETEEDISASFRKQTFLKAVDDKGKIVGAVRAYVENGTCFIGRLAVEPEYHGHGIGRKLMDAVEQEFATVNRYELFTGHKSERNIKLYQNRGYRIFKTEEKPGHPPLVFMEKYRD